MTVPEVTKPEHLVGHVVLETLRAALERYVVLPSREAVFAVVLWIGATHGQLAWEHASRLVVKSPLRRCGKTRLLEVIGETAHAPLRTSNISSAALVRSISEADPPTIILDEADTIFGKRRGAVTEKAEDIRGILNSGHSRGWPYIRWDAIARRAEHCPTFAMAALAAIGDLPDTIEDRAIVIPMRRRAIGEEVASYRRRRAVPELRAIRDDLTSWVPLQVDLLANAEPELPVEDRTADVWEPLIALAEAAGGNWPDRARTACLALTADAQDDPDDGAAGERLLNDLHLVFEDRQVLATESILDALNDIDEAPWADWNGKLLGARGLVELLKPFGVRSKTIRVGTATPRGYERSQLEDAWTRYRRKSATSATAQQRQVGGSESPENDSNHGQVPGVADCVSDSENRSETVSVRSESPDVAVVSQSPPNGAGRGATEVGDL